MIFGLEKHFWDTSKRKDWFQEAAGDFWSCLVLVLVQKLENKDQIWLFTMGYLRFHVSNFTRKSLKCHQILKRCCYPYMVVSCVGGARWGGLYETLKPFYCTSCIEICTFVAPTDSNLWTQWDFPIFHSNFDLKTPKQDKNFNFNTFHQRLDKISNPFWANLCHQCHQSRENYQFKLDFLHYLEFAAEIISIFGHFLVRNVQFLHKFTKRQLQCIVRMSLHLDTFLFTCSVFKHIEGE